MLTTRSFWLWCAVLFLMATGTAVGDIELIGSFTFPGTQTDHSQLVDPLPSGHPHNALGGFSAIEYLGGNRYLVLSDRGPSDGAVPFRCRWHELDLPIPRSTVPLGGAKLLATHCLDDGRGQAFIGLAAALSSARNEQAIRFDPEGLRIRGGNIAVSEEYGPSLVLFSPAGQQLGVYVFPERYLVDKPSAVPAEENSQNQTGRQSNRGPEGLAITPDGKTLVAAMQGPLLQDAERLPDGKLRGKFARLLVLTTAKEAPREFVYPLEDFTTGISEILAINDHEFLVLERDSTFGADAKIKWITRIDLSKATDVAKVDRLHPQTLPADIQPVQKLPLIDFLDSKFRLAGPNFPEKIEGLAFGPRLSDGRLSLIVSIDNDFKPEQPSVIHVFAITPDTFASFGWER